MDSLCTGWIPVLFDGAIHTGAGIQNQSKFAFFLATEGG
jgi:hypothetical protein